MATAREIVFRHGGTINVDDAAAFEAELVMSLTAEGMQPRSDRGD